LRGHGNFFENVSQLMRNDNPQMIVHNRKARRRGQAFQFFSIEWGPGEVQIYIHSKVLIVDDRFLCIGSAKTTNRSMGLDTELNLPGRLLRRAHPS